MSEADVPMEPAADALPPETNVPPLVPPAGRVASEPANVPAPAATDGVPESGPSPTVFDDEVPITVDKSPAGTLTYGRVRSRIVGKNGPGPLWRPPALRQDDFVAIMKKVTPELITNMIQEGASGSSSDVVSSSSAKRSHNEVSPASNDEPATSKQRTASPEWLDSCETVDVLIAEYISWPRKSPIVIITQ